MPRFSQDALARFNEADATKVLVTLDEHGAPYPVCKQSLAWDGERIVSWEYLESSETNRNLTRSIWFDKPVAILLVTADRKAYRFAVKATRNIVSGKEYTKVYERVAQLHESYDLAGIWHFDVLDIKDETLETRIAEEQKNRPYFTHLDRLVRKEHT